MNRDSQKLIDPDQIQKQKLIKVYGGAAILWCVLENLPFILKGGISNCPDCINGCGKWNFGGGSHTNRRNLEEYRVVLWLLPLRRKRWSSCSSTCGNWLDSENECTYFTE